MKTTLLLRYFLWGMLIFAISAGLLGFGALRTLELKTLNLGILWRARSQTRPAEITESRVVRLSVWGYVSNEAYLRNAGQIVRDLKEAGAKVVVIPLPDNLVAVPRILALLNAISRDSIVVFSSAMRALPVSSSRISLMNDERRNRWVRHPALHQVDILWGVSSVYTDFYIVMFVLLLSILSYNLRSLVTVGISILLALGVVVLSIWFFDRYSILFDPVYALVPILLCGVVLPVVKLAEERRMLEQTVKSLEEEKRRLEQLRRDQSLPM